MYVLHNTGGVLFDLEGRPRILILYLSILSEALEQHLDRLCLGRSFRRYAHELGVKWFEFSAESSQFLNDQLALSDRGNEDSIRNLTRSSQSICQNKIGGHSDFISDPKAIEIVWNRTKFAHALRHGSSPQLLGNFYITNDLASFHNEICDFSKRGILVLYVFGLHRWRELSESPPWRRPRSTVIWRRTLREHA